METLPRQTLADVLCLLTVDVVTKGLISDHIARGLWKFYHDQLSGFIAILDPNDTYDSMKTSAPATFNVVIAVTCRRHPDNGGARRSISMPFNKY